MFGHGILNEAEGFVPNCGQTAGKARNEDRFCFHVVHSFVGYHLIYTVGNGNAPVLRIVQYWI
jgi:hypothetical protein